MARVTQPLPLDDLLATLEDQGFRVSVGERIALARLLAAFDGRAPDALRNSVAALLARSREDVERIRGAFDVLYGPPVEALEVDPLQGWLARWARRVAPGLARMLVLLCLAGF